MMTQKHIARSFMVAQFGGSRADIASTVGMLAAKPAFIGTATACVAFRRYPASMTEKPYPPQPHTVWFGLNGITGNDEQGLASIRRGCESQRTGGAA